MCHAGFYYGHCLAVEAFFFDIELLSRSFRHRQFGLDNAVALQVLDSELLVCARDACDNRRSGLD